MTPLSQQDRGPNTGPSNELEKGGIQAATPERGLKVNTDLRPPTYRDHAQGYGTSDVWISGSGEDYLDGIAANNPFPFALTRFESGAGIYFGHLIVAISQAALSFDPGVEQVQVFQQEIPNPVVYAPVNLESDHSIATELGWFGDVFLQWTVTSAGVMIEAEIVGPTEPTAVPIPSYDSDAPGSPTDCLYFVKIGNVPSSGVITQDHGSDVFWQPILIRAASTMPPGP